MYITLISIFISISADPTTISLLHLPIATLCAIALLYTRYEIRKQEKDDDAARNLETVKALASIAETVKDSAATKELADVYCTVTRAQTNSQHNDNLPGSDSEGPKKLFRSPKN